MNKPRRERSELTMEEAIKVVKQFANGIIRFAETGDPGPFRHPSSTDKPAMGDEHINVCFMMKCDFNFTSKVIEAMRILGGHKLPAKAVSQMLRQQTYEEWQRKFKERNGLAPYPADAWIAAKREALKHYRTHGE